MILDMHATEQTLYKGEKDYPPLPWRRDYDRIVTEQKLSFSAPKTTVYIVQKTTTSHWVKKVNN